MNISTFKYRLFFSVFLFTVFGFITRAQEQLIKGTPIGNPFANNIVFDGVTAAQNSNAFFETYGPIGDNHAWIGLQLPFSTAVVSKIRLFPRGMTESWVLERIKGGRFEGANTPDFADAVVLATVNQLPNLGNWTEYTVTNTQSFKYLRYVCPDLSGNTSGPTASGTQLSEIEFIGTVTDDVVNGKLVYIPNEWKNPANNIDYDIENRSAQSDNFIIVWGPKVGNDPKTATDPNLRFDPEEILDEMEIIYDYYINQLQVLEVKGTLKYYKIMIVMNETWRDGLYTGWAFGGNFDNVTPALFVHPRSFDGNSWTISHELTHGFQSMIPVIYPGHGFTDNLHSGFFWETHANFMALQRFPQGVAWSDYVRALNFTNYYFGSPRKHYGDFYLLQYLKDEYGIEFVNRIWKESDASIKEHPIQTIQRLLNLSTDQMGDLMMNYSKRRINADFTIKEYIKAHEEDLAKNLDQYYWRRTQILDSLGTNHYAIPDNLAPQQYGFNTIRLYPQSTENCSKNYVYLKLKGHKDNTNAGWRYSFVSVNAQGVSTFSPNYRDESEISYEIPADSNELYLVVLGAPTEINIHTGEFEVGFTKLYRYPWEINIEGAVPEGYEDGYRVPVDIAGAPHSNGGGFVASTAFVSPTAYVGPNATVLGTAVVSGNARIEGKALVSGRAVVSGNAVVKDFAKVDKDAIVKDNAIVKDYAQIFWGCVISGHAEISDNATLISYKATDYAKIYGNTFSNGNDLASGNVEYGGDSEPGGACSTGKYLSIRRDFCDGKIEDDKNIDVNSTYTAFTNDEMKFLNKYTCGMLNFVDPCEIFQDKNSGKTTTNKSFDFIVYPNPLTTSSTSINIKIENSTSTFNLKMVDINGITVFTKKNCKSMEPISYSENLRIGVYFVSVSIGNSEITKKIIVN